MWVAGVVKAKGPGGVRSQSAVLRHLPADGTSTSSSINQRTEVAIPSSGCFLWGPHGRMSLAQELRFSLSTPMSYSSRKCPLLLFQGHWSSVWEVPAVLLRNEIFLTGPLPVPTPLPRSPTPSLSPQPPSCPRDLGFLKEISRRFSDHFQGKRMAALRIRI